MRVVITDPAEADLENIWRWIARTHPLNGARYVAKLRDRAESLAGLPRKGRPRDDIAAGCRALTMDFFLIVYRIRDDTVEVLRIIDGRQDLDESDPSS